MRVLNKTVCLLCLRPTSLSAAEIKSSYLDPYSAILFLCRSSSLFAVLFLRSSDRFFSKPFPSAAAQGPCFVPRFKSLPLRFLAVRGGAELRHSFLARAVPSRFLPMQFHRGSLRSFADPLRLFAMRSLSAAFRFLPKLSRGLAARIQTCLCSALPLQGAAPHSDPAAQHRPPAPLPGLPMHILCIATLTSSTAMRV